MQENKIILRSVYKVTRCWMEPAVNPITNRFNSDVVRKVNQLGEMQLSDDDRKSGRFLISENDAIEIFDGKIFDLDQEVDHAWWEAIKYSKKIAQDRWERDKDNNLIIDGNAKRYGNAEFYVERPGMDAKVRNDRKRLVHEAKTYIYQDAPENLYNKARLVGNPMPGSTVSDVEDYLISLAERSPQLISELYTGTDTHLRLLLLDAIDKRVIFVKDKLYYFGDGIVLGATDTAVIAYFKNPDNKRIMDLIKAEVHPDLYSGHTEVDSYDRDTVSEILSKPTLRKPSK
jgi:hypothetical protein